MIAHQDPHGQKQIADWSTSGGPHCPACGALLPFHERLSALIDMVLLLEAVLHDIKRAAEEIAS